MKIKTFLDLCSGIGGGRLDIEKAGLRDRFKFCVNVKN